MLVYNIGVLIKKNNLPDTPTLLGFISSSILGFNHLVIGQWVFIAWINSIQSSCLYRPSLFPGPHFFPTPSRENHWYICHRIAPLFSWPKLIIDTQNRESWLRRGHAGVGPSAPHTETPKSSSPPRVGGWEGGRPHPFLFLSLDTLSWTKSGEGRLFSCDECWILNEVP